MSLESEMVEEGLVMGAELTVEGMSFESQMVDEGLGDGGRDDS